MSVHRICLFLLAAASMFLAGSTSAIAAATATATTTATDGSIKDSLSVHQGALSYSLTLTTPPATNGIGPDLKIAYSSNARNGLLGVGFSLQGLSSISRCGAQITSDGFKGGVTYTSTDRYCFNGELLVQYATDTNQNPQFRTQTESWKRFTALGNCGGGPCSFVMQGKDGTVSTFAKTSGAAYAQGNFSAPPNGPIRAWMLDSVVDLNGNTMQVSYTQSPVDAAGNVLDQSDTGQIYPDTISYSASGGLAQARTVRFAYETRPDPLIQFLGGGLIRTNLRLTTVRTAITPATCNTNACATMDVLVYGLEYADPTPTTQRSRLSAISQCSASGLCVPETTLAWSNGANSVQAVKTTTNIGDNDGWQGDFNGDGRTDILTADGQSLLYLANGQGFASGVDPGFEPADFSQLLVADFNGDGATDIYASTSYSGQLYLGGASPFTCANGCATINITLQDVLLAADFNGDGLSDVLVASNGTDGGTIYLSNGVGFTASGNFSSVALGDGRNFVGDFNGDGRADVLNVGTGTGMLYFSTSGYNTPTSLAAGISLNSSSVVLNGDQQWVGDFNADGIADLMVGGASTATINYGTGTGLEKGPQINGLELSDGSTWLGDFNGDGLTDLYSASNTSGQLYLGTGTGFTCIANASNNSLCANLAQNLSIDSSFTGDFNGDGMTDIFYADGGGSAFNWAASNGQVLTRNGVADLLISVTNGYGGRTQMQYSPLSDPTVYTPTSAAGASSSAGSGLGNQYGAQPLFPAMVQAYPVQLVRGAQYVVATYQQDMDASRNSAPAYSYQTTYFYQGALVNLLGRGSLGFAAISESNPQLQALTTTNFRQDFPYVGKPETKTVCALGESAVCTADSTSALELVQYTWNCVNPLNQSACAPDNSGYSSSATQNFYVSPASTVRQDYKMGSQVSKIYSFDAWGNLQQITAPGDQNSVSVPLWTCMAYLPANADAWLFGFLQYQKKTGNGSCTNISNWQSGDLLLNQYAYDSKWNQTTSLSWDEVNAIWFGSYQTFNAQGLSATTADMSGNPAKVLAGSTSTTTYESAFLTFPATYTSPAPLSTGDSVPLTIGYAYDARFGTMVAKSDPAGNIINTCNDDLGRTSLMQGPLMQGATASPNCVNAQTYPYLGGSYTGNAAVITTSTTQYVLNSVAATHSIETTLLNSWTGSAGTTTGSQLDGMGRDALATALNDANQQITSQMVYLDAKHLLQQSLPSVAGAPLLWQTLAYDPLGRKLARTTPTTDSAGDTTTDTTTWSYGSGNSLVTTAHSGTPSAQSSTTTLQYCGSKTAPVSITRSGGTTQFAHDGLARMTSVTQPDGKSGSGGSETISFDGLGRIIQRTSTAAGARSYVYDSSGNLDHETDARQQSQTYTWDALHRVLTVSSLDAAKQLQSTTAISYDVAVASGYDNVAGQRASASVLGADGKVLSAYQYGYDAWGNSTRQDLVLSGQTFLFDTAYDPQRRSLSRTLPMTNGERPQWAASYFAQNGLLQQLGYAANGSNFLPWANYSQYSPYGRPGAIAYGNGATERYGYTPEGQVATQQVNDAANSALINAAVEWNVSNEVQGITDCNYSGNASEPQCAGHTGSSASDGSREYAYTDRRLSSAQTGSDPAIFCYDAAGNLLQTEQVQLVYQGNRATTGAVPQEPDNCASTAGASVLTNSYDDNGNLYQRNQLVDGKSQTDTYAWSVNDELAQYSRGGVVAERYSYDFTGRRLLKLSYAADGTTINGAVLYLAPDYELALDASGGPALATVYLSDMRGRYAAFNQQLSADATSVLAHGLGVPVAAVESSGAPASATPSALVLHRNIVGSTEVVTDSSGLLYARVAYSPYGVPVISPSDTGGFRPMFNGKELDASGLYYFTARYFDPAIGRFISADSQPAAGVVAQDSFNAYAFGLNNPALYADPSGHGPLLGALLIVAAEEIADEVVIDVGEGIVVTVRDVMVEDDAADMLLVDDEMEQGVDDLFRIKNPSAASSSMVDDDADAFEKDPKLKRAGWRKQRVVELRVRAGSGDATAAFKCPTCPRRMTGEKVKQGARMVVDYDIDHIWMTHAQRAKLVQFIEASPKFQGQTFTRKQFIDIYHEDLRLQCPSCNRSHQFEPSSWEESVYTWVFLAERTPVYRP